MFTISTLTLMRKWERAASEGGAERGGAGQGSRSRAGSPWESCIQPCYSRCDGRKTIGMGGAITLLRSRGEITHARTGDTVTHAITRVLAQYRTRAIIGSWNGRGRCEVGTVISYVSSSETTPTRRVRLTRANYSSFIFKVSVRN